MPEERLTKKQSEFLECFKNLADANNYYSPSLRELQKALGYKSVSTAAAHADALVGKGYLRKEENAARSLRLVDADAEAAPSPDEKHLEWLRQELKKREGNEDLSKEAAILKAALQLLDQTDKE